MNNSKSILITISLILGIALFSNFQNKPIEYRIIDGYYSYRPSEVEVFYYWNGRESISIYDRNQLLDLMRKEGFELVSTHSVQTSNSGSTIENLAI